MELKLSDTVPNKSRIVTKVFCSVDTALSN